MQLDPGYRLQNNPLMSPAHLQVNPTPYELWSVGPNQMLDFDVFDRQGFIYYDTSNGTNSIEDIVWIRP